MKKNAKKKPLIHSTRGIVVLADYRAVEVYDCGATTIIAAGAKIPAVEIMEPTDRQCGRCVRAQKEL